MLMLLTTRRRYYQLGGVTTNYCTLLQPGLFLLSTLPQLSYGVTTNTAEFSPRVFGPFVGIWSFPCSYIGVFIYA